MYYLCLNYSKPDPSDILSTKPENISAQDDRQVRSEDAMSVERKTYQEVELPIERGIANRATETLGFSVGFEPNKKMSENIPALRDPTANLEPITGESSQERSTGTDGYRIFSCVRCQIQYV